MASGPAHKRLQVDDRRRQLLDAGAALFAEHAYEEISMRQVAHAAGVSKPLLHHYFPSKIQLFNPRSEPRSRAGSATWMRQFSTGRNPKIFVATNYATSWSPRSPPLSWPQSKPTPKSS